MLKANYPSLKKMPSYKNEGKNFTIQINTDLIQSNDKY